MAPKSKGVLATPFLLALAFGPMLVAGFFGVAGWLTWGVGTVWALIWLGVLAFTVAEEHGVGDGIPRDENDVSRL